MKQMNLLVLTLSAFGASIAVGAVEAPRLKPGLWEMHYQSSAGGTASALPPTICIGAMSDSQRQVEQENIKTRCGKVASRETGGNWVMDMECTARGHTVTKHVIMSLAGDTIHEANTAPQGSSSSDGKWLGPCKAGQKPEVFKRSRPFAAASGSRG